MVIGRVVLKRSLCYEVSRASAIRVELFISSEFNEPIPGLLGRCNFTFACCQLKDSTEENFELQAVLLKAMEDTEIFEIIAPESTGKYKLIISCQMKSDEDVHTIVLSYMSDIFTVATNTGQKFDTQRMLSNYRMIPLRANDRNDYNIIIKEEYGASMGSHIYDSAVVLCHYFQNQDKISLMNASECRGSVLELGSGCGLVGIWLACTEWFRKVLLTDKLSLQPLLVRNIAASINANRAESGYKVSSMCTDRIQSSTICEFSPLEWSSRADIACIMQNLEQPLTLIVAADVLYGTVVTTEFFAVLLRIMILHRAKFTSASDPTVILAQKMRSDGTLDLMTRSYGTIQSQTVLGKALKDSGEAIKGRKVGNSLSVLSPFNFQLALELHSVRVWNVELSNMHIK